MGHSLSGGLAGAAAGVMPSRGSWEDRTLGTYQLGSMIGVGGMGEVYRARDTRLGRDVAVKILTGALTGSAERLARFEREARILATLNHPNIAAIYGIEESAGVRALVLELVEGVTLAEKLQTDAGVARALPLSRCAGDRATDCPRVRGRASEGDRPSRSEAGQHQDRARWHREGARLRRGEVRRAPRAGTHRVRRAVDG